MKKRANGTWQIEIRDQRLRGKRLSISSRTTSKPTARRREAAIRALLDAGEIELIERLRSRTDPVHIADLQRAMEAPTPAERARLMDEIRRRGREDAPLVLGPALDRSMQTIEATLAWGSVKQYRTVVKMLKAALGEDTDLRQIGRDEVERFLHEKKPRRKKDAPPQPWSPGRQEIVRTLAGRLWNDAIEREAEAAERTGIAPRLRHNPWKGAEVKGERQARVAFLQPEEWRVLIAKTRGTPAALFLGLGCLAGLRMMEAAHLRPGIDVDLTARVLRIQPRKGERAWETKTDRSVREVPIGAELMALVEAHIAEGYAGERYLLRLSDHDRPVSYSTLRLWTVDAFEAAGIRYGREGDALTYHSLRHTFASWLVQRDVQLMKVARLLGDTVEMVTETYGHLMPTDLERAIGVLDQVAAGEKAA